jgi:hypothetical protein
MAKKKEQKKSDEITFLIHSPCPQGSDNPTRSEPLIIKDLIRITDKYKLCGPEWGSSDRTLQHLPFELLMMGSTDYDDEKCDALIEGVASYLAPKRKRQMDKEGKEARS